MAPAPRPVRAAIGSGRFSRFRLFLETPSLWMACRSSSAGWSSKQPSASCA